ncbi:MAG: hypothetical protein OEY07_18930, partial [Gammaproteobacteria bacterium]|nr:hypothetical protein [Gammaproteobacteria bacterium]
YTGSVYMCLLSLLESKQEELENKNIGIFSYGSGCGAEFLISHVGRGLQQQLQKLNFRKQIDRRIKISMDEYAAIYGDKDQAAALQMGMELQDADPFSRFIFTGIKEHKRQYVKTGSH